MVGRFCFVAGDTLEWTVEADQSISSDVCDACWMSEPAWNDYDSQQFSDPFLFPEYCEEFDHCHHSTPENINCGIGYLDETDSTSVGVKYTVQTPQLFSISNYPSSDSITIEFVTIASTGNSISFGDMTVLRSSFASMSDCVRGVFAGGDGSPAQFDEIDYFNIATTGDAVDFGDLPYDNQQTTGCSNGHGGLG